MVDHSEIVDGRSMFTDKKKRRSRIPSYKFRLCKKMIRISSAKNRRIQDNELEMHRFCTIKNTLKLLQHEAHAEKLRKRARSPSPPCDMEDTVSDDGDEQPPRKRARLIIEDASSEEEENENDLSCEEQLVDVVGAVDELDDVDECKISCKKIYESYPRENDLQSQENEKELSCEEKIVDTVEDVDEPQDVDETQKILKQVYGSCTVENVLQSQPSSPSTTHSDTPINIQCCSATNLNNTASSLVESSSPTEFSCSNSKTPSSYFDKIGCSRLSGCIDKPMVQQQPFNSNSTFLGSDLQSVVYQSLISSL